MQFVYKLLAAAATYLAEKKSPHWSLVAVDLEEDEAVVAAATGRPVEGGGGRRPPVEDIPAVPDKIGIIGNTHRHLPIGLGL